MRFPSFLIERAHTRTCMHTHVYASIHTHAHTRTHTHTNARTLAPGCCHGGCFPCAAFGGLPRSEATSPPARSAADAQCSRMGAPSRVGRPTGVCVVCACVYVCVSVCVFVCDHLRSTLANQQWTTHVLCECGGREHV